MSSCNPGDTRLCVGPGACRGGQLCASDRKWGLCDCGTGGGLNDAATPVTGGTSGAGGAPVGGTGGTARGGAQPDAGSGGSTAGTDAATGWVDDPCLGGFSAPHEYRDCSLQCQSGDFANASKGYCFAGACENPNATGVISGPQGWTALWYLRTAPGSANPCQCTSTVRHAYLVDSGLYVARYKVTVEPPWFVRLVPNRDVNDPLPEDFCGTFGASGCVVANFSGLDGDAVVVFTEVENPPARNVTFEQNASCP